MLPHLGAGCALCRGASAAALHLVLPSRHHGHRVEAVHLRQLVPRRKTHNQHELASKCHAHQTRSQASPEEIVNRVVLLWCSDNARVTPDVQELRAHICPERPSVDCWSTS